MYNLQNGLSTHLSRPVSKSKSTCISVCIISSTLADVFTPCLPEQNDFQNVSHLDLRGEEYK